MISEIPFSLVYYDIICSLTQLNVGCKMNTLEYNNAFQLFIKPINIQDCLKSNRDRMLFYVGPIVFRESVLLLPTSNLRFCCSCSCS